MPDELQSVLEPIDERLDHGRGPESAKLILQHGDYEWPYSPAGYRSIQQLEARFRGEVPRAVRS